MAILSDKEKDQIREAIKEVEASSSGELVTVIARASDEYYYIPVLWAALVALALPGILLASESWTNFQIIYLAQVISFFVLMFLFRLPAIKMKMIPRYVKQRRASRFAKEQFFQQGLQGATNRNGILLFVSVAEHYVEIIGDKGINEKVEQSAWDEIIADFVNDVRQREFSKGFIGAINACGVFLSQHYPEQERDTNELPDHLVEL